MVDLHSHVLFDIDDGAQSIEESLAILKRARDAGINKMMATPHFSIGEDVDKFLDRRKRRFDNLKAAAAAEGLDISLKAGAEVYITDEIFNEDRLPDLTFEGSNIMLTEFRYHSLKPETFLGYVDEIISNGIKILVAHPERYSYLMENARLLDALLARDVLLQVNAISLFEDSDEGDFARFLVKNELAHVIAGDIHHPESRRIKAMKKLGENSAPYIVRALSSVPDEIFEGVF
ncbi:MAG: hypothetical protein IJ435_03195 [Clostridia bacterium]|nr:hypothetical protein [Clostridia bacterium]